MTINEITRRQERENLKHHLAIQIRKLLDEGAKQYKVLGGEWADEDIESEIQNLVFEE